MARGESLSDSPCGLAAHCILYQADNGGEDRTGDATTDRLSNYLADVDIAGGALKDRQERGEERPPPAPPIAPAMVLPSVPRSTFLRPAPMALPPTAPAMSWIIRLIIVADIAFLLFQSLFVSAFPCTSSADPVQCPRRLRSTSAHLPSRGAGSWPTPPKPTTERRTTCKTGTIPQSKSGQRCPQPPQPPASIAVLRPSREPSCRRARLPVLPRLPAIGGSPSDWARKQRVQTRQPRSQWRVHHITPGPGAWHCCPSTTVADETGVLPLNATWIAVKAPIQSATGLLCRPRGPDSCVSNRAYQPQMSQVFAQIFAFAKARSFVNNAATTSVRRLVRNRAMRLLRESMRPT